MARPSHAPEETVLSYLSCPHCALSIRLRASWLAIERCPRCLARRGAIVALEEHSAPPRITALLASNRALRAGAAPAAR